MSQPEKLLPVAVRDNYLETNTQNSANTASNSSKIAIIAKKKNKQGQFRQPTESTQGEYLDRLLAKAVIQVAQEFNASSIVLPPIDRKIEKAQSELEAYAEEEIPEDIGTQKKLTSKTSVVIHKWSYNRLSGYLKSNAAKLDIAVETGSLQSFGTLVEQATAIAMSVYNSRKHGKR